MEPWQKGLIYYILVKTESYKVYVVIKRLFRLISMNVIWQFVCLMYFVLDNLDLNNKNTENWGFIYLKLFLKQSLSIKKWKLKYLCEKVCVKRKQNWIKIRLYGLVKI